MSAQTDAPIMENADVAELAALLQKHRPQEAALFAEAVRHVADMEKRLAEATEELKAMRQEIRKMQDAPLKSTLERTERTLGRTAAALREKLSALKTSIAEGCRQALSEFRTRGVAALDGIARFFHLRPGLEAMRAGMDRGIQASAQAVSRIEAFSKEYHEAGRHLKNMGRTMQGKEALAEAKPVGRLAKSVQAPYKAGHTCLAAMRKNLDGALASMEKLEQAAQRRPSVLKAMRENSEKIKPPAEKAAPTPDRGGR